MCHKKNRKFKYYEKYLEANQRENKINYLESYKHR